MVAMHFEVRNFLSFLLLRILVWVNFCKFETSPALRGNYLLLPYFFYIIDQSSSDGKRKVVNVASIAYQRVTKGLNNVEINKEKLTF